MRPAGKRCECEGCSAKRVQQAELDRQEGTRIDKEMEVWRSLEHCSASHQLKYRNVAPTCHGFGRCEAPRRCMLLAMSALGEISASLSFFV